MDAILEHLRDPAVTYISVKISAIFSQINLLDWTAAWRGSRTACGGFTARCRAMLAGTLRSFPPVLRGGQGGGFPDGRQWNATPPRPPPEYRGRERDFGRNGGD